jgi:hypothetical protein
MRHRRRPARTCDGRGLFCHRRRVAHCPLTAKAGSVTICLFRSRVRLPVGLGSFPLPRPWSPRTTGMLFATGPIIPLCRVQYPSALSNLAPLRSELHLGRKPTPFRSGLG